MNEDRLDLGKQDSGGVVAHGLMPGAFDNRIGSLGDQVCDVRFLLPGTPNGGAAGQD